MKNLIFFLTCVLICASVSFAQSPDKFSYQGFARDNTGNVITNQAIGLRINIKEGSAQGTIIYSEVHATTTNQFGLFSIAIGDGTPTLGSFGDIAWGSNSHFIQTELDATGGTNYLDMGTSQLLSVPYAKYADSSGVSGPTGPTGPTGPAGPAGVGGADGPAGPTGASGSSASLNTGFWAYSSPQVIANATYETIEFANETFDDGQNYNTSTYEYTVPEDGVYFFSALARWHNFSSATYSTLTFNKNGQGILISSGYHVAGALFDSVTWNGTVKLIAGDKISFKVRQDSGDSVTLTTSNFSGHRIY